MNWGWLTLAENNNFKIIKLDLLIILSSQERKRGPLNQLYVTLIDVVTMDLIIISPLELIRICSDN